MGISANQNCGSRHPPPSGPGLLLWGGGALLWLVNGGLRFWGLTLPRWPVFDEAYYVSFAANILQNQPFFDAHPPLGKYWIALNMACLQVWQRVTGGDVSAPAALLGQPLSYRGLNAVLGATVPLLGAWMAWEWSRDWSLRRRRGFAGLVALLLSWDGLLLVESRLALLHITLVASGVIGLAAWGRSRHSPSPFPWRLLAGVALGASMGVKWSGAGYWLALVCLEAMQGRQPGRSPTRPWLWLGIVPLGTYLLAWVPYLALTGENVLAVHRHLWQFHHQATTAHPYQSRWYTWPLMVRPIAYFYQGRSGAEPWGIGPPTPAPDTAIALYGLGHPLLIWLSTAAMLLLWLQIVHRWRSTAPRSPALTVSLPIGITYLAHWVPWAFIHRTTFFYHYLPAALMAEMGLAWVMSGWLTSDRPLWRRWAWGLLGLLLVGFLFWLPLWVGYPLAIESLHQRWWLPSWR